MSSPKLLLLLITSIVGLPNIVGAQPPPPAKSSGEPVKIYQRPSLKTLTASETFISIEGRFVINLPKGLSGFGALSPRELGFNGSGAQYRWSVKEGSINITFAEFLDSSFLLKSDSDFQNYFAGVQQSILEKSKGKVVTQSSIKTDEVRGIQLKLELPDGKTLIYKSLYGANRQFLMVGLPTESEDSFSLISKAFDSFRLVPQSEIDAQLKKSLESATPESLPQTPVVPKEGTDAEDENLKGKVRTVTQESEDRSGTWGTQGRKMSSVESYNENGNLTKRVSYDSSGRPFQITAYGYLEGSRASKYKMIDYPDDPPPMLMAPSSGPKKVIDERYSYKYAFKYQNGKQTERQMILNNGEKGMRYVTTYGDKTKEYLVYDVAGKLNMKTLYVLNSEGDEVERTEVNVLGNRSGDDKYLLRYESFDVKGNWTKKITSKLVSEGGKLIYKDWYVTYRTFDYY